MKKQIIKVNGIQLSVKEAGTGQDMILIHGKGYSKENMDRIFNYYKDQYHVVSYGRILNVSSDMHNPPGGLTWPGAESLAHPKGDDRKSYSYSKLCMIYMTHELDQRIKADGKHITINSFNPGYMGDTNFMNVGKFGDLFVKLTMKDRYGNLSASSDALAKLVTEDSLANLSGEYFDRNTETARSSELSYNSDHAKELWSVSMRYVDLS